MADRSIILVALGCAMAVAWMAYEWQRSLPVIKASTNAIGIEQEAVTLPEIPDAPGAGYPEITERPLFEPTRRPQKLAVAEPKTLSPKPAAIDHGDELKAYRLTAVLEDADSLVALIESAGNTSKTIATGDHLGSWKAAEIHDDRVVLTNGSQTETLTLRQFAPPEINRAITQHPPRVRPRRVAPPRPLVMPANRAVARTNQPHLVPPENSPHKRVDQQ